MTSPQAAKEQEPVSVQEAITQLDYEVNNLFTVLDALELRLTRPEDLSKDTPAAIEIAPVTLLQRTLAHTDKVRKSLQKISNIETYLGV